MMLREPLCIILGEDLTRDGKRSTSIKMMDAGRYFKLSNDLKSNMFT
jgi:hypothetical protein